LKRIPPFGVRFLIRINDGACPLAIFIPEIQGRLSCRLMRSFSALQ